MSIHVSLLIEDEEIFVLDSDVSGIDDLSVTYRIEDENDNPSLSFSSSVTFTGEAYNVLYRALIQDVTGNFIKRGGCDSIKVNFYDDCCVSRDDESSSNGLKKVFVGKLDSQSLDWCFGKCSLTADIVQDDEYSRALNCLKTTRIYSNRIPFRDGVDFTSWEHPFVKYCVEMRPAYIQRLFIFFTWIIMFIFMLMAPIFLIISTTITIINLILAFVNFLGADISLIGAEEGESLVDSISFFDDLVDFLLLVVEEVNGCGRGHPAPFIRDYIINVCQHCGLSFESSILNNPLSDYYNSLYLYAPTKNGKRKYVNWIDDNKPLHTGHSLLKELGEVFNAKYKIVGNRLIFERKDFFFNNSIWLDYSAPHTKDDFIELCFSYVSENPPAAARFSYMQDALDWVGNEARGRYNDLVDWDEPFGTYPCFKGLKEYNLPISCSRFLNDGIEKDVIKEWYQSLLIIMLIPGINILFGVPFLPVLLNSDFQKVMLLSSGMSASPKYIIWDGTSSLKDVRVLRGYFVGNDFVIDSEPTFVNAAPLSGGGLQALANLFSDIEDIYSDVFGPPIIYNFPYFISAEVISEFVTNVYGQGFSEFSKLKPYIQGNLYDRFWYIDDSRLKKTLNMEYTLKLEKRCSHLEGDIWSRFEQYVLLPENLRGSVDEIIVGTGTLTIKGRI